MATPTMSEKQKNAAAQLFGRLENCWSLDINWTLYPDNLRKGCSQVGVALNMPPTAVLLGLMLIVSFTMSHSTVHVEGTDWIEPVILWLSVCMPTGSGKSTLCKYLKQLVEEARSGSDIADDVSWMSDDQSFEKLGALMDENHAKLLGLYDELAMFLSQMNVMKGKGVTDSYEASVFLGLYGGNPWIRRTVSGDANFHMKVTGLTVGGFIQPSIARNLLEQPTNVDKGVCQRFMWFSPKQVSVPFEKLEKVNEEFSASVVCLMSGLWRKDKTIQVWYLKKPCEAFRNKYNKIQEQLKQLCCMDELLSGMLSKAKGQILRVAATLHVLFHIDNSLPVTNVISDKAITAAIDLVDVCIQHAAYLAGRGNIEETIQAIIDDRPQAKQLSTFNLASKNARYSLLLDGKVLHLTALLSLRKFRDRGNKTGAILGFEALQEAGLGKLTSYKPNRGAALMYEFEKAPIPDDEGKKTEFLEKLMMFGVSITQYDTALKKDDITVDTLESRKRPATQQLRRSPRKKLDFDGDDTQDES